MEGAAVIAWRATEQAAEFLEEMRITHVLAREIMLKAEQASNMAKMSEEEVARGRKRYDRAQTVFEGTFGALNAAGWAHEKAATESKELSEKVVRCYAEAWDRECRASEELYQPK